MCIRDRSRGVRLLVILSCIKNSTRILSHNVCVSNDDNKSCLQKKEDIITNFKNQYYTYSFQRKLKTQNGIYRDIEGTHSAQPRLI